MARPSLTMAFVMDPIEAVDIQADTTFALMLEAQERGHRLLYVDPGALFVASGQVAAQVRRATLRREAGRHVDLEPVEEVRLDEAHVVFQRTDPPVDADYMTATQMLALCRRALVVNRPSGILAANEKLFALHFPELMVETLVTRSLPALLDFLEKVDGDMIVKPLDGKGGEGVFHLRRGDRNLYSILEQSTNLGRTWTMAQRYIPQVREGDKRILLLDGDPLGALLRIPAEDETRANLHVGGRAAACDLDDTDRRIIDRLAPVLRREGLFFVGIDVIGGRLTEVNVTSPTGLQEIETLTGASLATRVIEAVEARVG